MLKKLIMLFGLLLIPLSGLGQGIQIGSGGSVQIGGNSLSNSPPVLDLRAFGAVCNGTTSNSIDAALQEALNSMTEYVGGVIQIVGNPSYCYLANPTTITWPTSTPVVIKIQGELKVGTTLQTDADIVGNGGASCADFQPGSNQCAEISIPTLVGTLGTAVSVPSMPNSGTSVTFTPSTMTGLYKGTAITVTDQLTCTISTVSQPTSGIAVAYATVPLSISAYSYSNYTLTLTVASNNLALGESVVIFASSGDPLYPLNGQRFNVIPLSATQFTISESTVTGSGSSTATASAGCHIPPGTTVTVSGVANSAYNGSYTSGGKNGQFFVSASDYVNNTITYSLTGQASSSTGGTITGLNDDTIENVLLTSTTSSTATAVFYRPHTSSANWGVVGVYSSNPNSVSVLPNNPAFNMIKNVNINDNGGTGLWEQGYQAQLDNVGVSTTGGCGANYSNFALDAGSSTLLRIDHSSFIAGCQPWSVHLGEQYLSTGSEGGGLFIDNSSFLNGGVKLDHGGVALEINHSTCETCTIGMVTMDNTNYWNGSGNYISIENSLLQDNGFANCWVNFDYPAQVLIHERNLQEPGSCDANDYVLGQLDTDDIGREDVNGSRGNIGKRDNGKNLDVELRGEGANFSPSLVPYATLSINAMSGWGCTSTSAKAPDGSSTACEFNTGSGGIVGVGYASIGTPAVGDQIIACTWIYSPTNNAQAVVGQFGAAFDVAINNSTHFYLSPSGTTFDQSTNGINSSNWDSAIADDWWHPVCAWAEVTQSDGTSGQSLSLYIGHNSNNILEYWDPSWMYIPASAGYSKAEVMRWRQQLMHAYVPAGAAAGTLAVDPNLSQFLPTTYTVATLPTCGSSNKFQSLTVSDASSPTYLGTLTGSGTVSTPVMCNGTSWVSY